MRRAETRGQHCGRLAGDPEGRAWCAWRMTGISHARDVDVQQARRWRSWWCALRCVDASASTLLSLSVGGDVNKGTMERDAAAMYQCSHMMMAMSMPPPCSRRCSRAPYCFRQ